MRVAQPLDCGGTERTRSRLACGITGDSEDTEPDSPVLRLTGTRVFGGIEVTHRRAARTAASPLTTPRLHDRGRSSAARGANVSAIMRGPAARAWPAGHPPGSQSYPPSLSMITAGFWVLPHIATLLRSEGAVFIITVHFGCWVLHSRSETADRTSSERRHLVIGWVAQRRCAAGRMITHHFGGPGTANDA
jgi:hypothetical protein